jgi:hypothetical protein
MTIVSYFNTLKAIISQWAGVESPRKTQTQVVYSVAGVNFVWYTPGTGMVQIYPSLGPDQRTRRLERHGSHVKVIRQRTGAQDAEYYDPGRRLKFMFSYPGFRCSQVPQDEAESLVRQAYEQVRRFGHASGSPRSAGETRVSSSYSNQNGDAASLSPKLVQVPMEETLVQRLDSWSRELGRSRANIIREACRRYLKHLEREKLDRLYREGYERFPEEPVMALTQEALLGQVLPKENW